MQTRSLCRSTIGLKFLVALSGLFMLLFLVVHLLGNLEIFSGPDATNQYGVMLRTFPKVLWAARILLIIAVVTHVWVTIVLTRRNAQAREQSYALKRSRKATLSSRTMMLSGLTILAFVIYHLAHYTLGITNPEYAALEDHEGRFHIYNMVVMGFSNIWVSGFYILAQALLACHLSHGISSAARTLGLSCAKRFKIVKQCGQIFAWSLALLFMSIPIAVLLGLLPLDT